MATNSDIANASLSAIDDFFNTVAERVSKADSTALLNEELQTIWFWFERKAVQALQILDQGVVICLEAQPSGRRIFQCQTRENKDRHYCFEDHYCSCHSFFYEVVQKSDILMCKHQVACRIARATQSYKLIEISDVAMAKVLASF